MNPANLLLLLTNTVRAEIGLVPLRENTVLAQVAQEHAAAMALGGYFDHIDNAGRGVGERLLAAGYNYRWCGENISAGKHDAAEVMRWWLSSDGHRANILKPEFVETGFGYYFIAADRNVFHHYWVQVFATHLPG